MGHCATTEETDGIGLVMTGDRGMIAFARGSCNNRPALEFLNFSVPNEAGPGRPLLGQYLVSVSKTGVPVSLSPTRASAMRGGSGLVVFTGHVLRGSRPWIR